MIRELVLNDLSLVPAAESIFAARKRMDTFVSTLVTAVRAGAARALRTTHDFNSTLLAPGYSLVQWRNDSQVPREERSFFRALASKAPFLTHEDGAEVLDRNEKSEFRFEDRVAFGLGAALLLEGLSVSFASEACWESPHLTLKCLFLDEQGNLDEELAEVPHACRPENVSVHTDWLSGRDIPVQNGAEIWERREQLFSSLILCESVGDQLSRIHKGDPLLRQIFKRLEGLERFSQRWDGGLFDPAMLPMKITGESPSTLQKYSEERTFLCPDGEYRLFVLHTRLTPGAWRLYFLPDSHTRRIFVGYIGKKPASTLYPTI